MAYDIFISYRRKGAGAGVAGEMQAKLQNRGYNVFLDVDNIASGAFPEQIDEAIKGCSDFLLILSPGVLDRCADENDWVRHEIVLAEKYNKNIIGVSLPGFVMPEVEVLPEPLKDLPNKQVFLWSHEYRNASIEKIKLNLDSYKRKKKLRRKWSISTASGVALLVAAVVVVMLLPKEIEEMIEVEPSEPTAQACFDQHARKGDSLISIASNLANRDDFVAFMQGIAEYDSSLLVQKECPEQVKGAEAITAKKEAAMKTRAEKMNVEIEAAETFIGVNQYEFAQFRLDNAKILGTEADTQALESVQRKIDKLK